MGEFKKLLTRIEDLEAQLGAMKALSALQDARLFVLERPPAYVPTVWTTTTFPDAPNTTEPMEATCHN